MPQSIVQPLRRGDPEQIGPYSIIGKLGAGAMGQVFLARSTAGRLVAVTTLREEPAREPGAPARSPPQAPPARPVCGGASGPRAYVAAGEARDSTEACAASDVLWPGVTLV